MMSGFSCQSSTLTHICARSAFLAPYHNAEENATNVETYLSERAQACEDASPNPRRVLALRRRKDLDAHILDRQPLELRQQAITEALCECAASGENNVAVQCFAEVQVCAGDGVVDDLMDARVFIAYEFGVEEDFWCAESFCSNLCIIVSLTSKNEGS
jgi:hypothetical protein